MKMAALPRASGKSKARVVARASSGSGSPSLRRETAPAWVAGSGCGCVVSHCGVGCEVLARCIRRGSAEQPAQHLALVVGAYLQIAEKRANFCRRTVAIGPVALGKAASEGDGGFRSLVFPGQHGFPRISFIFE